MSIAIDRDGPSPGVGARSVPTQPDPITIVQAEAPPGRFDVAIIGLGYVGLPTALAFHAAGRSVVGIDVSPARLQEIREQQADLLDSDRARLAEALQQPTRFAVTAATEAMRSADAVIICVPTPVDPYLVPDLSILRRACVDVVANAVAGQAIILTSTTYVGSTGDLLTAPLAKRGLVAGSQISVAFSPERIDPGNVVHQHEDVPRVVGGVTPACTERACEVLAGYARTVHRVSSPDAAEMVKLVENTFRAVNIALANEIADVCHAMKLPVLEVIDAAATKPYGFMPFYPGPGVGGHCIPCDPHYLLWQLRRTRLQTPVIARAMDGIAARPLRVVERLREVLSASGSDVVGARVLVVGVAYKPDVEDVRESPALEIISALRALGANVAFADPHVPHLRTHDGERLTATADPAGFAADVVLLHTRHSDADLTWLSPATPLLDATYRHAAEHGGETV